jgi:hypothetical protein
MVTSQGSKLFGSQQGEDQVDQPASGDHAAEYQLERHSPSQTVAGKEIEAGSGEEPETDNKKHNIAHNPTLRALFTLIRSPQRGFIRRCGRIKVRDESSRNRIKTA